MAQVAYREIPGLIQRREEFQGNTMSAKLVGNTYRIYSYSTPIARVNMDTGAQYLTTGRYSVTTAKHKGYVRRAFGMYADAEPADL